LLAGIEPAPAEGNISVLHPDQGDCRSPWTHRAKGFRAPCNHGQDFRVLNHDPPSPLAGYGALCR